jgi:hypothetical protein
MARTQAQRAAAQDAPKVESCRASIDERTRRYSGFMANKKFWDARTALDDCPELLNDAALLSKQKDADLQHWLGVANNTRATIDERLGALGVLQRNFPADAAPLDSLRGKLQAQADRRDKFAEASRRKKEGVSVGMTQDEAIASSWGKPRKVNRTTTSYGVREQWVYDGGYLYFKDGVLTSIQN